MKKILISSLMLLLASASNAALIQYGSRAAFDAANPTAAVEDFEDVNNIADVLAGTGIEAGLSLSLTSGTDAYFATPGQSSNPTNAVGVNTPRTAGWNMDFSVPVNAVAFDVFQNNGGGSQFGFDIFATVDVFSGVTLLSTFQTTIPSGQAGFFGVFSNTDLITRVTVNEPDSYDVIDNVAFNKVARVSAPATLVLLSLGFIGITFFRKQ